MTATTERTNILDQYLDLDHLHPGITISQAARRLGCNADNLRRRIADAIEAGDTRIPHRAPEPRRYS